MKTPKLLSLVVLAIATIGTARAQERSKLLPGQISKAKANAISYIKAHREIMTGYKVMGWSEITTYTKPINSPILFKKVNDPLLDDKIDSVIMLQQLPPSIPDRPLVYSIMHTFQVNVPDSGMLRRDFTYYFDPSFNVISIDKRPADEKVKMLMQQIEAANTVKRLIADIRDYKIAHLKQN